MVSVIIIAGFGNCIVVSAIVADDEKDELSCAAWHRQT